MKPQVKDTLAPRPVHPRAIRHHGFFGATFVKQHMVMDEKWSTEALVDEFQAMANLLGKRVIFKHLENKSYRKTLHKSTRHLRTQLRDGRSKLQNVLIGDNSSAIRNILIKQKDMQRCYQKMPIHMVVEDINQRTFMLRKERDRFQLQLQHLKKEYELKLLERASIENRIKYQNEFVLDEELKMRVFMKNIENSNTRLRAIKTINATYEKVMQILRQDEIFYEPILRSLCLDIEDQANFIKHVLYLGQPAIAKFKQLSEEYRLLDDKNRKSSQFKHSSILRFKKLGPAAKPAQSGKAAPQLVVNMAKHYARETKSMLNLKNELENIETTIKEIKEATLRSRVTEIFPRIKSQVENNYQLIKQNEIGQIEKDFLAYKEKLAGEKEQILLHNYFEQEEKRISRIQELKEQIKTEDEREEKTLAHMKNRATVFVLLRYSLWNLSDIMRHIGSSLKIPKIQYPNSYLKLPLLKYEMLTMYAVPPHCFEENTKTILYSLQQKLKALMNAYKKLRQTEKLATTATAELRDEYHKQFLYNMESGDIQDGETIIEKEEELVEDLKISHDIPNRKQIKALSARLVKELAQKDN